MAEVSSRCCRMSANPINEPHVPIGNAMSRASSSFSAVFPPMKEPMIRLLIRKVLRQAQAEKNHNPNSKQEYYKQRYLLWSH